MTLLGPVRRESEVRRSRFVALLSPASTMADATAVLAAARAEFPDAGHHCFAAVVGADPARRTERSSDDGEPGGTAGVPMLSALNGRGVVDVAAVVVRYFGGVKLGAGGLVRAYSGAVTAALDGAETAPVVREALLEACVEPAAAGKLEAEVRRRGIAVVDVRFEAVAATLTLADPDPELVEATVAQVTAGEAIVERVGHRYRAARDG